LAFGRVGRTPIRIAFVHSFYSSRVPSGENRAVDSEVDALRRAGHEVGLFAARTDDFERSPTYRLTSALRVATGRGHSPLAAIRPFGPDVVHIHNLFPNFATRWVGSIEVPVVITLHNFRLLCANGLLFRDGHICTLCPDGRRFAGVRYACYRDSRLATLPQAWANRLGPAAHPLIARADRIVVPSNLAFRIFSRAGLDPDRIVVRPHFVPRSLDAGWGEGSDPGRGWLFVGRIDPEKGVVRLMEAWPPGHRLSIVGDGPALGRVRELARGKEVELLGRQERPAVLALMRESLGLVVPSLPFESSPLVYVEAMATGLPVLAWEPNVITEFVREHGTGLATTWEADLAATLRDAEERFPVLRQHCRQTFEDDLSEEAFITRTEALYSGVLAARSTGPAEEHRVRDRHPGG
jgi:glycosyltransferase involved in cell wall biosynthesis